jgi:hypothetical protein
VPPNCAARHAEAFAQSVNLFPADRGLSATPSLAENVLAGLPFPPLPTSPLDSSYFPIFLSADLIFSQLQTSAPFALFPSLRPSPPVEASRSFPTPFRSPAAIATNETAPFQSSTNAVFNLNPPLSPRPPRSSRSSQRLSLPPNGRVSTARTHTIVFPIAGAEGSPCCGPRLL